MIFSASNAQRGPKPFQGKLDTIVKPQQNVNFFGSFKNFNENEEYDDYYDYYYDEEPLPSGPTKRPALVDKEQKPSRFTG